MKFHENPSSWSRVVPCEQPERQTGGCTVMTKLTAANRNFANRPKIGNSEM